MTEVLVADDRLVTERRSGVRAQSGAHESRQGMASASSGSGFTPGRKRSRRYQQLVKGLPQRLAAEADLSEFVARWGVYGREKGRFTHRRDA